jgi:hypothetical protein
VIKAAGEGEEECDSMAGKMLVVAAAHIGDDDVTLDQLVVEPCTAEAGSGGANPAQFCSPRQQLGWHCAVGGISVDDVLCRVLGIDKSFDHHARHRASDFLGPGRIDIGGEQQNFKAH